MARFYVQSKGLGHKGHCRKVQVERFLTLEQVQVILKACEDSRTEFNRYWYRDYAAIYLGFMLGLRIGECCILERRHFCDLETHEVAHIPTLKQSERIPYLCRSCGRRCRVMADRIGKEFPCPRCNSMNAVATPHGYTKKEGVPEKDPPLIESQVVDFIVDYMKNHMRPDQRYLFETRGNKHISVSYLSRIFGTYAMAAGLSNKYSWHSLRHGRGVRLWRMFRDANLIKECLRQSSIRVAEVYIHMDPEETKKQRKELEKSSFDPLRAPPKAAVANKGAKDEIRIDEEEKEPARGLARGKRRVASLVQIKGKGARVYKA